MDWYWWVAIAIGGVLVINAIVASRKPRRNELLEIMEPVRQRSRAAETELDGVIDRILNLSVRHGDASPGSTLARGEIRDAVSAFLKEKLEVGLSTSTLMVHVATSPYRVTAIAKRRPTKPAADVRMFERLGENAWSVRTHEVAGFEAAKERVIQNPDADFPE